MKSNNSLFVVILISAIAGIALFVFSINGEGQLSHSPVGNLGMTIALEETDIEVVQSRARVSRLSSDFGAQIIPIYDSRLPSRSEDADFASLSGDEFLSDLYIENFDYKIELLPSLVILPKWKFLTVQTRVANERTAIALSQYQRLVQQLRLDSLQIDRHEDQFVELELDNSNVAIFAPQFFKRESIPDFCQQRLGFGAGALIISCDIADIEHKIDFVSDPDFFNNHGLSIAQNSEFARQFLREYVADLTPRAVYLNDIGEFTLYESEFEDQREDYERDEEDLLRYFQYPLSVFWGLMAVVLGVLLWRGNVRFGAIMEKKNFDLEVSSAAASGAMARILRMTGNDASIIAEFVKNRIDLLAKKALGDHSAANLQDSYFEYLKRQGHPDAAAFEAQSLALIHANPSTSTVELYRGLENFRNLTRKVVGSDEFE